MKESVCYRVADKLPPVLISQLFFSMSGNDPANAVSNTSTSHEVTEPAELLVVEVDPGNYRVPDNHELSFDPLSDSMEPTVAMASSLEIATNGNALAYFTGSNVYMDLDTADMGHMQLRLVENANCKMDPSKLISLRRSVGILEVLVFAKNLNAGVEVLLRGTLQRANPELRQIPVDFICQRHINDVGPAGRAYTLQAATDPLGRVEYAMHGMRRSVIFHLGCTRTDGTLPTSIDLRSMCNDDCNTSNHPRVVSFSGPRFMILVLTLEATGTGEVLARRRIALHTWSPVQERGMSRRDIPRGLERPPPTMHRQPRGNHRPAMTQNAITLTGIDCILRGTVAVAIQFGISVESFISRVQYLYAEMSSANPFNMRT